MDYSTENMTALCQFKDSLGHPGVGVHAMRIPGTDAAAFDVVASLALVWFLAAVPKIPMTLAFLLVFGSALCLHMLFCVKTGSTQVFTAN